MSLAATEIRIAKLPRRQASALKRKAKQMGLSTEDYVKQLIEDDLALDEKAKTLSLSELAAPFRKALTGATEEDIVQIVSESRSRRRN
jgi:hypothetical protein